MKDILIKVSRETRMVDLTKACIGNDGENLQTNLIFTFKDEFVNGQGRVEYIVDGESRWQALEKVEESYQIPVKNVMTKVGSVDMQLVITEGTGEEEIPVFKSNWFYMHVNKSINAVEEQPDGYDSWLEIANSKLNEIDNLDIDVEKVDGVATITVTKKDGTQESVEVYDGTGTGGGTSNYENLENKPQINGVELNGNKTTSDLGIEIPDVSNFITKDVDNLTNYTKTNELSNVATSGDYNDLNNRPTIPTPPTKTSELINDSGFITDFIETDPTIPTHIKGITEENITNWNNKQDTLTAGENITIENNVISATGGGSESGSGSGIIEVTDNIRIPELETGIYKVPATKYIYTRNSGSIDSIKIVGEYGYAIIQKGTDSSGVVQDIWSFTVINGIDTNSTTGHRITVGKTDGSTVKMQTLSNLGEKQIIMGTKSSVTAEVKAFTGYDSTQTQVLKNVAGTLTWETIE